MALSTIIAALYACGACSLSASARGDTPVEGDREGDEDYEYPNAPGEGLPAVRAHWLTEEEATYRVHDLCHRLVVGECLQGAGHVVCLDVRAACEGQGEEPDKACRLHGLGAAHEECDRRPDPREREAEEQQ